MAYIETNRTLPTRHNPYLHDIIIKQLSAESPGKILDLPSGPGYLLKDLQEHGHTGIAGEIDESLHCFNELEYRKVDMTGAFPFEAESFDYVTSIEGIEHIENHNQFFRECYRILRPGGKLFLTTPNIHNLASRWNFFISGFHSMAPKPIPVDTENIFFEHINPISLNQIYFYASRSGFRVKDVQTYRYKKGASVFYYLLYPLFWWGTRVACQSTERNPTRKENNREIQAWLTSKANLVGTHTIVIVEKS